MKTSNATMDQRIRELEATRTWSDEGKELARVFKKVEAAIADLREFTDLHNHKCKCDVCTWNKYPIGQNDTLSALRAYVILSEEYLAGIRANELYHVAPGMLDSDAV